MAALEMFYGTFKCSREIVICQSNSKFLKAKDSTWNFLQCDQAGILKEMDLTWLLGSRLAVPSSMHLAQFSVVTFKG